MATMKQKKNKLFNLSLHTLSLYTLWFKSHRLLFNGQYEKDFMN